MARAIAILLLLAASLAPLHARQADDGWNFEEEEEVVPTFADEVRAQAVDLAAVAAFSALAFASFFRKSERLKVITLIAAVAYLGFYKSQLISIVNVFGLLDGNLPLLRHNLAWYLLAIVTVASTVLWGRVYCGRICAFGAFTQLVDRVVPARWQVKIPGALERRASTIKYGILAGAVGYFLLTRDPLIYPYIEPFWMFGLHATPALWVALGALLVATVFVRNAYCRFLCPVGAALGVLSKLTVFRIKRWSECKHCRICEKACEWGAIRGPQIVLTECVRCDDCERLYADTTKCPHHLIIIRKSEVAARRAAAVNPVVALLIAMSATAPAAAQERTVDHGVYSAAQAARGATVFDGQCATCHREGGVAPVLAGERFMKSFGDATLESLFTTIKTTMPRTAPASLSDADYTDIVAYLLRLNSYPDGMTELALADLAGIKIPGQTGSLEFALVQVVGCLSQQGRNWTLAQATDPVRTREPEPAKADEAAQLDARAPGSRTFRLQQVYGAPAGWTGQKVAAKGFLTKTATDERITVSSLRVLTSACPSSLQN